MKVRSFVMGDYTRVRRLWIDAGLEIRPGDDRSGVARKLEREGELFLVAEERGRLVGTVMGAWDGRRGWVYHLGVPRLPPQGRSLSHSKQSGAGRQPRLVRTFDRDSPRQRANRRTGAGNKEENHPCTI